MQHALSKAVATPMAAKERAAHKAVAAAHAQLEQVTQSTRALGQASHFVDLERGVRRNGKRIADDIHAHIEQVRAIAQHEGLSQRC